MSTADDMRDNVTATSGAAPRYDDDDDDIDNIVNKLGDFNVKTKEEKIKERQMNFIAFRLKAYPDLKLKAYEVYNNHRITKNKSWSDFRKTLNEFLISKVNETHEPALRTTSFKPSHQSAKPSAKPSANLSNIASTSIEPPGMGEGGNKSRRNIRRRRKSKKQKRVRHTRRKQTRRHRHSRRR